MRLPEFLLPSLQILWAEKGGDVYHAGNHKRRPQSYIERGYDRWDTNGHLLSITPNVIMNAMMMYDLTGMMSHTLRFSMSIPRMRRTFLNSILTNILENNSRVAMQPTAIASETVPTFVHVTTPILHTLKPAVSQMTPAMKASDFVFILLLFSFTPNRSLDFLSVSSRFPSACNVRVEGIGLWRNTDAARWRSQGGKG